MRGEYRKKLKMVALGFLNRDNAPTPEAAQSLPDDLETPPRSQSHMNIIKCTLGLSYQGKHKLVQCNASFP